MCKAPTKATAKILQIMPNETTHMTILYSPTTIPNGGVQQKQQYFCNCVHTEVQSVESHMSSKIDTDAARQQLANNTPQLI